MPPLKLAFLILNALTVNNPATVFAKISATMASTSTKAFASTVAASMAMFPTVMEDVSEVHRQ